MGEFPMRHNTYKASLRQESKQAHDRISCGAIWVGHELTQHVKRSGFGSKILERQRACIQTRIEGRDRALEHHPARVVV
jgi:hypothetical protein